MEGVFNGISNAKQNVQNGQDLINGLGKEAAGVASSYTYDIPMVEAYQPIDNTNVNINLEPIKELPSFEDNTADVFGDRMHEIIERPVPDFVGSSELNEILEEMQTIDEKTREEQEAFLETLATELYGEEYTADQYQHLDEQLDKFIEFKEMLVNETEVGYDPINEEKFGEFLGSLEHYKFGEMVGESIGMDPLFASMLSPTGGLVGPGNTALNLSIDNPIGVHGIVHDAAGFLFNGFDIGPGYAYKGDLLPTSWPIAGQISGVVYWTWDTIKDVASDAWEYTTEFISNGWDTIQDVAADAWDTATDTLVSAWDYAKDTVKDTISTAQQFAYDTVEQIGNTVNEIQEDISNAWDSTQDYINNTWDSVQDTANDAKDALEDFANDTWDFVSGF